MEKLKNWFHENKKTPFLWMGVSVVFIVLMLIVYGSAITRQDRIIPGVQVEGTSLSGKTREQAEEILRAFEKENQDKEIQLKGEYTTYKIPLRDLGYKLNVDELVDEAYAVGRSGDGFENIMEAAKTLIVSKHLEIKDLYSDENLDEQVKILAEKIDREPEDAQLSFTEKDGELKVKLTGDHSGTKLNQKKTRELLQMPVEEGQVLELPIKQLSANIKKEDLVDMDSVLGEFSTDYSSSEPNRKDNIALSSIKFSHVLLKPGEEISFLNTIGDITKENGFKTSNVISDGEFQRGLGGGICQVSTTLYNAIVRADLEIVERHSHSKPIGYVANGTDAAVVQPSKDLIFKNDFAHPVYITAKADGKKLEYIVYGSKKDKDYDIELVPVSLGSYGPKTVVKYSNALYVGQQKVEKIGSRGYSYKTYRVKKVGDKEVERTLLNESYYTPSNRVVIQGTKPMETQSTQGNGSNSSAITGN